MERPLESSYPRSVEDASTARDFIRWCIAELGLGYHPDTPFGDYVTNDGARCFTDEQAEHFDVLNDRTFEFCDPYEIGLAEFQATEPRDPNPVQ